MSDYRTENDYIVQAVAWTARASEEIRGAGGYAPGILSKIPDELLTTLVRNKIGFKYYGPTK